MVEINRIPDQGLICVPKVLDKLEGKYTLFIFVSTEGRIWAKDTIIGIGGKGISMRFDSVKEVMGFLGDRYDLYSPL